MHPIRRVAAAAVILQGLVIAGLLSPAATRAQPVEELLPDEVAGFTLEEVNRRSPAAAQAVYGQTDGDLEMQFMLAAGEPAGEVDRMLRSRMSSAEVEVEELSVDGKTFTSFVLGSDLVVFRHADGVLLGAGRDDLGQGTDRRAAVASVVAFLESFGPDRLEGWTPPEGSDAPADANRGVERPGEAVEEAEPARATERAPARAEELCGDMDCFLEAAGRCRPAVLSVGLGRAVTGKYRVDGPADGDRCGISFRFTENPNPDFVGEELRFHVGRDGEISEEEMREVVRGCLEGEESVVATHGCEGPLVGGPEDGR